MNRVISFPFLIAAIAALAGCSGDQAKAPSSPQSVHVAVLSVHRSSVPDTLEAVGTVRAAQTSILASQMMGNVVELRVHEGDHVRRGEVLAVIDDSQLRAGVARATAAEVASTQQLAVAEADLALAESTLHRYQNLLDKKSVSPQEFDEVKARQQAALARRDMAHAEREQAAAALAQARTAFDYTRIRAPFDGVITEKKVDAGALASPGMPLLTIEDVRRYRLEATVNETDLAFVQNGATLPVLVDAVSQRVNGKVAEIIPAADPGSRSFLIKIDLLANPNLRSGLFGRAQFSRGERQSLLIPKTAVVNRGQLQGVFTLDAERIATLRYISLGRPAGAEMEVLAGLQEGDRVVATPGTLELDGKQIEAQP